MKRKYIIIGSLLIVLAIIILVVGNRKHGRLPEFTASDSLYKDFWTDELSSHFVVLDIYFPENKTENYNKQKILAYKYYKTLKKLQIVGPRYLNNLVKEKVLLHPEYKKYLLHAKNNELLPGDSEFKKWLNNTDESVRNNEDESISLPLWDEDAAQLLGEMYELYRKETEKEAKKQWADELCWRFFRYYLSVTSNLIQPSKNYEYSIRKIYNSASSQNEKILLNRLRDPFDYKSMKVYLNSAKKESWFIINEVEIVPTGSIVVPNNYKNMSEDEYKSLISVFLLWCRNVSEE